MQKFTNLFLLDFSLIIINKKSSYNIIIIINFYKEYIYEFWLQKFTKNLGEIIYIISPKVLKVCIYYITKVYRIFNLGFFLLKNILVLFVITHFFLMFKIYNFYNKKLF